MKKMIFFISCFFLMMNGTSAITLDCPEVASPGEEIVCHIEDDTYIGIKAKYNFKDSFTYQNINVNSSFKVYYSEAKGFAVGNVSDDTKLSMDLKLKVNMNIITNQDYSIFLEGIEVSTLDGKYEKINDVSATIKILSDINTLDSLEVKGGELEPDFDKEVTNYEVIVDSDKTEISATLTDDEATIEGDIGEKTLEYGVNNFSIKVTSARGTERVYSIYVIRPIKDSDITLKRLEVSSGDIDFKKDQFFYKVDVVSKIDKVDVIAEATSKTSTVKIEKPDKLVVGDNVINIIVTAEDGSVGVYTVLVNRARKLSDDATVKSLTIKGYNLNFKSDIFAYQLEIGEESSLDISVVLNDSKAKYSISGNKNLQNGSVINIKVTAEAGNTSTYMIVISRKLVVSDEKLESNDVTIKSLVVKGYDIDFDPKIYDYQLEIKEEDKLDIEVILNDTKSKYEIVGNENLEDNSLIKIIVTALDGSIGTYTIKVHKNKVLSSDASIRDLIIEGYEIEFDSDVYEYELEIRDEDNLDIKVVLNDDNATYKVVGNENLSDGSIIRIRVTAEDGSNENYQIKIIKKDGSNVSNLKFIPLIVLVVIVVIILGVKIIKKKLTKKESNT